MMFIDKVTPLEFQKNIKTHSLVIYDTADFCELNKDKVDTIDYLIIKKGTSPRFAIALGINKNQIMCPFSAPFGTLMPLKASSSVEHYDEAMNAIMAYYATANNFNTIFFRIPPLFYAEHELSAFVNSLHRKGFMLQNVDLNFAINIPNAYKNYDGIIKYDVRRNLRIAKESNLTLKIGEDNNDVSLAYDIILQNRTSKGYPLRMTKEQVLQTLSVVAHDVFIVQHEGQGVASAIVYHVNDKIAQVIYWGDIPGVTHLKSINYLAYQLIQYYGAKGFQYLDIGPSTENSIPNYGLCDFKESIGCERSLKFSMQKVIRE